MGRIKVILSTFGPLHLIKSAEYLSSLVEIRVIQGWIPQWWNRWLLKPMSMFVGYDLSRTIKKRTPACLKGRNYGIAIADFADNFSRMFLGGKLSEKSGCLYGWMSKKYIHKADIFHVRSGSGMGGAIEKARRLGMKIVVDHSIAHPAFMENQLSGEYKKNGVPFTLGISNSFWQSVLSDCKKADYVLVNSYFVKRTFIENGFDKDKMKVVYLGVRNDFVGLKKDYSLNGSLKILFTGGWGFRKGAEYSLRAMQMLDEKGINYEYIVVGNNSEGLSLVQKYPIKHLKLVGMVPQDELKSYLSDADIYLFPSLCEGCASSGMEAMAAGLPVIATEESGFPIINGQNGIIVPSKDVDSIYKSILQLKEDHKLRENIGNKASKTIADNYSWEQYAKNVTSIYNELLK